MNKVLLIGNVGKTPETTVFDNGKKVTKFSLATTEFFGKDNKEVTWHNIVIWGDYGETMAKYISVGSQISAEGRIQYGAYEKEGVKQVTNAIVVEKIELLNSKKSETTTEQPTAEPSATTVKAPVTQPVATSVPTVPDANDDLPF